MEVIRNPWEGGDKPPYVHFYTGPTKWPELHGTLRKPLGNLPDLARSFGRFAMDIGPIITTKHILAKDGNLDVLFRNHASVKAGVDEIHALTDHVFHPATSAQPTLYNMPDATSNIFVYAMNYGSGPSQELVAHYGIGTAIDHAEAGALLQAALGEEKASEIILVGDEGHGFFKDSDGKLGLTHAETTQRIITPLHWSNFLPQPPPAP